MNFKHNQKVVCEIDGKKVTDAKISIDKYRTPYICQNEKKGTTTDNLLGYKYSWQLNKDFTNDSVTNLKPFNKTIRDVEIGDILIRDGDEQMVLDVREKIVALSEDDDFEIFGYFCTFEELEEDYKLKDEPEEVEELTVEQVCKELGRDIKIIK